MHRLSFRLTVLALLAATPVLAQKNGPTRNGPRPLLSRSAEIALARSAAPPGVSAGSRVWVFTGSTYVIGDSGTSRVNCYVGRPWSGSLEPHCFDPEGSATAGTFRLPSRPAMTYMMSAAQNLITDNGTEVEAWQAHLMIYHPFVTPEPVGGGGGVMLIENPGQALAALIIPLEHFVPAPDSVRR